MITRALSLRPEWAHCIAHGSKRLENRTWKPPAVIVGQRIAIHASGRLDARQLAEICRRFGYAWRKADVVCSAIVATAIVSGHVIESADPWFVGPLAWVLTDVVTLAEPIACKGALSVWRPAADVAQRLERTLEPSSTAGSSARAR
jgi:hypothetical protein